MRVSVSYNIQTGTVSLKSADNGTVYFAEGYIRIETDAGIIDSRNTEYQSFATLDLEQPMGKAVAIKLSDKQTQCEIGIRISIEEQTRGFGCVVLLNNTSGRNVRVLTMDPLVIESGASEIFTGTKTGEVLYFRNGFHSWELSQASSIERGENTSHQYTVVHNTKTRNALVFGFTTAREQLTTVQLFGDPNGHLVRVVNRSHADNIPLEAGASCMSEELLVLAGTNAYQLVSAYINKLRTRMQAVSCIEVPQGWCSWYFYLTQPDENEIIENAKFLSQWIPEQVKWIQLDDGYQRSVGDWEPNERFEGGLQQLTEKIRALGFEAGIWVAPFIATERSNVFLQHPNWFVTDEEGKPLVVDQNPLWLGNYYAFDLTQIEVLAYIESVFKELKRAGFEYFKIDFLYHAVTEGKRLDETVPRGAVFRKALELIRRAVGDAIILGCGAPLGPCIGFVNAMRIGTDIAPAWRYDWGGGVYECSINTMTRAVMHDRLWINDPDCVLVRQEDTELTLDEVLLWVTLVAMSGGAFILSDRMMDVSEERLHIIERVLPVYRQGSVCLDYLDEPEPRLFAMPIKTDYEMWVVLAVVNLTADPIDIKMTLDKIGLANERVHIFEFWSQTYMGDSDTITISHLPPHSCRLLVIRPIMDRPTLLSTSIHFTQGAVEFSEIAWDSKSNELAFTLAIDTHRREAIYVISPNRYRFDEALIDGRRAAVTQDANIVKLESKFRKGQSVIFRFHPD